MYNVFRTGDIRNLLKNVFPKYAYETVKNYTYVDVL